MGRQLVLIVRGMVTDIANTKELGNANKIHREEGKNFREIEGHGGRAGGNLKEENVWDKRCGVAWSDSRDVVIEEEFSTEQVMALNLSRIAVIFNCNGFIMFNPAMGRLTIRVDNCHSGLKKELVIINSVENFVVTLKRNVWILMKLNSITFHPHLFLILEDVEKRLSLHNEWRAFLGDKS
ncbi:hypothetical protein KI387_009314, partial [Taxus chinensis]